MTVYVLNLGHDYEGERTVGVFATEAAAVAAAQQHRAETAGDDTPLTRHDTKYGSFWANGPDCGWQYTIYPFAVA